MRVSPLNRLTEVLCAFRIDARIREAFWPFGGGHIHATSSITTTDGRGYIAQELNSVVFADLDANAENLRRIDDHFTSGDLGVFVPTHLRTDTGSVHATLADGSKWRLTRRIDDVEAPQHIDTDDEAFDAAAAFGTYVAALATLPGPPLRPTIGRFHDFAWRVEQLSAAVRSDSAGRASSVGSDLNDAEELAARIGPAAELVAADNSQGVHNDAKVTNLLCSTTTGDRWPSSTLTPPCLDRH